MFNLATIVLTGIKIDSFLFDYTKNKYYISVELTMSET